MTEVLHRTCRNRRSRGEEEVVRHHSGDGFQIAQEKEKERERMALMMGYSSSDTSVATTAASGGAATSENESDKERSDSETEITMRIRAASVYGSGEHAAVAAAAALVPQKSREKRKKRTASTRVQRVKEGSSKWLQRTSSLTNIKPVEGQASPVEGEQAKEEVKTIVVLEVAEEAQAQTSNGKKEKEKKNKKEKKERKQEKRKKKEKSRQAMDAIPRSESEDGLAVVRAGKTKAQAEEVSPPTNAEQPAATLDKAKSSEEAGSVQSPPSVPPTEPKSETASDLKPELEGASAEPAATVAVETPEAEKDERMRDLAALAKAVTKAVASSVKDVAVESSRPRPIQQHQRSNTGSSHNAHAHARHTRHTSHHCGRGLQKRRWRSSTSLPRRRRSRRRAVLSARGSAPAAPPTPRTESEGTCALGPPGCNLAPLIAHPPRIQRYQRAAAQHDRQCHAGNRDDCLADASRMQGYITLCRRL